MYRHHESQKVSNASVEKKPKLHTAHQKGINMAMQTSVSRGYG
jgi:hypothetical protein